MNGGLRMRDSREKKVARVDFIQQSGFGTAPLAVDESLACPQRPDFPGLLDSVFELFRGHLPLKVKVDIADGRARTGLNDDVPGFAHVVLPHFERDYGRKI